jgi:integrase
MLEMETTDFMLQLARQLIADRNVAESTATAYIKTLYQLNDRQAFKNLTFIKNVEAMMEKIASYAESTQRAIFATIVSVLSLYKDKPTFKKVYKIYYDKMMEFNRVAKETDAKHEKSEKQMANWISWEEIENTKKQIGDEVAQFKKTITPTQYEKVLQYLVLSLYTDVQPRRNQDYLDMYIVKRWSDKMPTDKNYLDLAGKRFIFNKYKTSRKYGTQTVEIPDVLWTVVGAYLARHPLWKGVVKRQNNPIKLLVGADASPIVAVNAITRLLNRVFGKKIGSSMLRHIYLSDKYKDTVDEMKADADAMGHSVGQQRAYVKRDSEAEQKFDDAPAEITGK